jgi:predicted nucleotidyltransferase component of viral defense system
MHNYILSDQQQKIIPLIDSFADDFGLVGGTAIALQVGHRYSIDFDLFTHTKLDHRRIRDAITQRQLQILSIMVESNYEFTLIVDAVKLTFYQYPYSLHFTLPIFERLSMPSLRELAAMKAFALGKRSKWKDYLDLYFLLHRIPFNEVVQVAQVMFGTEFNQKLFRAQLCYFDDIDYSEQVQFVEGHEVDNDEVQAFLTKIGVQS